ncbi:DNA repair protein RAD5B [Aristolochia californica]|uniref:DNA repair protein RAD5B n=1 Tax=Aristolochia californica TaxID=171875 RepID=UPI0035DCF404
MSEYEERIEKIRSVLGSEIPDSDIVSALNRYDDNVNAVINLFLDSPGFFSHSVNVMRTSLGNGVRVKKEATEDCIGFDPIDRFCAEIKVKDEKNDVGFEDEKKSMVSELSDSLFSKIEVRVDKCDVGFEGESKALVPYTSYIDSSSSKRYLDPISSVKSAPTSCVNAETTPVSRVNTETTVLPYVKPETAPFSSSKTETAAVSIAKTEAILHVKPETSPLSNLKPQWSPINRVKPDAKYARSIQVYKREPEAERGDFPEEPDWFLVGRTALPGLSTCKGRNKLEDNEIVHFNFPSGNAWQTHIQNRASWKAASAASEIVRFSTKRYGEIGRLNMEWARCLIPLVNSSKVKVHGRCLAPPHDLSLLQEIPLYVSLYIHSSIFTKGDTLSWSLVASSHLESTTHPLPTLFKLLKMKPFQKAEFTPDELDSRKRSLNLKNCSDESLSTLPPAKRGRGDLAYPEQTNDEQAISVKTLNKLVGSVDTYDLKEMEPPSTLECDLRSYQKQALYWMSESEKGINVEEAAKTLHPCWEMYHINDKRASAVYLNVFSGEVTTQFPSATQAARGGILADAMGLGKTVMTIALVLAKTSKGSPDNQELNAGMQDKTKARGEQKTSRNSTRKVKGGTLIVCPMALLGQWKDELENHSQQGSLSISVHYGGDRTNDPTVISEPDVVLTTYGVLASAYKSNSGEESIFHKVEWYRVVLDEAHTIKSSKTLVAQAAFALTSYCRWCLTGTPLQNSLEDLYSLLCFLHVEPWCNWAWWNKLIQKPYENGDERAVRLVKAILRSLMLRRTKESTDKDGRPILVLPPADIQIIECEQSEAERDFYEALFKKSKVKFEQFVAQGKVLHNYASILELLLRLRQCCNHPFLVMSRGDTDQYADLNKLACKFLEAGQDSGNTNNPISSAYVEQVVEGIRKGEATECPICLESPDDPILTPCAHRMCRECLFSSWRSPSGGLCPICRNKLTKADLITCPSENRFRIDVEKNWTESAKVTKLIECLEKLRRSGEKSIVFSQWTSFLDLLQIPLTTMKIGFLRFDGKLGQKQRERVLKEFTEGNEKMVLLMSLKAGGVGLNLTAASNVFLMDPWWNPAVEEQAIMRIHRFGQKRKVHVRRFIVRETIEERMQQVQARKERMIAGALTDTEVRTARIEELKMLFR